MIDLQKFRQDPKPFEEGAKAKNITLDTARILELDTQYREHLTRVQVLREDRNKFAKEAASATPEKRQEIITKGKEIKEKLEKEEVGLSALKDEVEKALYSIPNPAKEDVKVGKDDSENDVIRKYKEPTAFDFTPKDHVALGEALDLFDSERAAKVSGARFTYLKNEAALLEFALAQFAFETLVKEGFIPIIPPVLIKKEITSGLGYWDGAGSTDYYGFHEEEDNLDFYLVGTAEHAIVPMHKDELFQKKDLPLRYVGFSSAFRREAGTYGKDTRGILRMHQFDKVEMVSFVPEGEDDKEHEYLLSLEEKLFQALDIPYQVIKMCTGDLGFPAARKYDIEAWMPGQDKYREVTSVSTVTDFQSRRLNIKYTDGDEKKFVQILNGTAFSMNRPIIAILENYQQKDGTVLIPEVLRKWVGKDKISPK